MTANQQKIALYRKMALAALAAGAAYLFFRIKDFTLCYEFMLGRRIDRWNSIEGLFPFLVFGIEIIFIFELGLFLYANWKSSPHFILPIKEGENPNFDHTPFITVLIPTYNEPAFIVEKTLLAAASIDYPFDKFEIILLDDQGSSDKEKMVELNKFKFPKIQFRYESRIKEGQSRTGFKAGNLNFGIKKSRPETMGFLLLDADHRCQKSILKELVPYAFQNENSLWNPNFGFVQAPQTYSIGPHDLWDRPCREFQFTTQSHRAYRDAVMMAGSSTLLSAEALQAIGLFDTSTVTEDLATGAKLQGKGYRCFYHPTPVAVGLVPDTLLDIFKQRMRWAYGSFQFLKNWRKFTSGMKGPQKASYLSGISQFLMAFPNLALAFLPPVIILAHLDAALFYSTPSLIALGLFVVFRYLAREAYGQKTFEEKVAGAYLMLIYSPVYVAAFFLAIVNPSYEFWTTPKGMAIDSPVTWRDKITLGGFLFLPLMIGVFNLAGMAYLTKAAWGGRYPLFNFMLDYAGILILSLYFAACGFCSLVVEKKPSFKTI